MRDYNSNPLCIKCNNDICKVYGGRCRKYNTIKYLEKYFNVKFLKENSK